MCLKCLVTRPHFSSQSPVAWGSEKIAGQLCEWTVYQRPVAWLTTSLQLLMFKEHLAPSHIAFADKRWCVWVFVREAITKLRKWMYCTGCWGDNWVCGAGAQIGGNEKLHGLLGPWMWNPGGRSQQKKKNPNATDSKILKRQHGLWLQKQVHLPEARPIRCKTTWRGEHKFTCLLYRAWPHA